MSQQTLAEQVAAATLAAAHLLPGTREGWLRLARNAVEQAGNGRTRTRLADNVALSAIDAALEEVSP